MLILYINKSLRSESCDEFSNCNEAVSNSIGTDSCSLRSLFNEGQHKFVQKLNFLKINTHLHIEITTYNNK